MAKPYQRQNSKKSYDANLGYAANSAKFPVLSENHPKTALDQIVARANGTTAAIFTTALVENAGFLPRQFGKK